MNPKPKQYIRISYDILPRMPVFIGNPPNRIEPVDSFEHGEDWNTFSITLFNHNGTHIDGPNHFERKGKKICDYRIGEFIFDNPLLLDIPKKEGEAVSAEDFPLDKKKDCDILLIRTGFYKERSQKAYVNNNPWISPEAGRLIREQFKTVKAVGIDTISIGSPRYPQEAIEAHRILLRRNGPYPDPPFLVEDLHLGMIDRPIKKIFFIPLFVVGVDSMPCTAFVEVA
jgi:kynurenine formamidase